MIQKGSSNKILHLLISGSETDMVEVSDFIIQKLKLTAHDKDNINDTFDDISDESESDSEVSSVSVSDSETESESDSEEDIKEEEVNLDKKKSDKNSNEIFKELIKYQLSDIPAQWKLNINDMKRICKYIDTSVFDANKCCIWNGYITNINNSNKGTYVNFYFRNKKVALHRLLYSNFVAPLDSSEYLKFNCNNKGVCCNVNHYEKYKYSKNTIVSKKEFKPKEPKKDIQIEFGDNPNDLIINFD